MIPPRTKRPIVALAALGVAPLIVSIGIDHRSWTCQWRESAVALGLSAPRYPWIEEVPQGPAAEGRRDTLKRLFLDTPESGPARAAHLHGAWLIRRERWNVFTGHPMGLLLYPRLSSDGRQFFADTWSMEHFASDLRSALADLPLDVILRADLMGNQVGFHSSIRIMNSGDDTIEHQRNRAHDRTEEAALPSVAELWARLVEAGAILHQPSGLRYTQGVMWFQAGNVPGMNAWTSANRSESGEAEKAAYAAALSRLAESSPVEFLESALDHRVQRAWETLGLDPREARYAAEDGRSASAQVVGWHCALHLGLIEQLFREAMSDQNWEEAAEWVELQETVALVLSKSVRSPWVFNYIHQAHRRAGSDAQVVLTSKDCPADVAARMAGVVARSPTPTPRLAPGQFHFGAAAFCLENIARSCLRVSVLTLLVAAIGWLHLRRASSEAPSNGALLRGSWVVAIAAVVFAGLAFAGLEATNRLGEKIWGFCYASAFGTVLLGLAGCFWWLVLAERTQTKESGSPNVRRRMRWLIGCLCLLAMLRLFAARSSGLADPLKSLELLSPHSGLPAPAGYLFGVLLPALMITYAVLRWRRWRREPQSPPTLHPVFVGFLGAWIGLWIVLGPLGEWWYSGRIPEAFYSDDFSPMREAVQRIGVMLQGPVIGPPLYGHGQHLSVVSIALRTTNFGVWLILVCVVLWSLLILGSKWTAWLVGSAATVGVAGERGRTWLRGVSWSCLWLGLASFVVHGWCTLGAAYCITRVM